jgi:TonB-dependent SusC/RagA subfamily outer membrane receptor
MSGIKSACTIALALFTFLAADGSAQQPGTGTITGQVRDARSGAPVTAAQIHIPGLSLGVLSQANGRFLLINVPVGNHELRAERIGYRMEVRQVTVTAGQAAEVNFQIAEDALALDEIVVTGTAGQARRREVGNTISQINMTQVNEPVADLGGLLTARVPGLTVIGTGNSGSGADIRLRGNVSATMSNTPLIYIDGVRAKSEPYPPTVNPDASGSRGSVDFMGPLSDINPADIERIEIVKGPAATTLYGTEAAAGVIQIFTKRGGAGATQWSVDSRQGFSYLRPFGPEESPFAYADPILQHGHRQQYGTSFSGGRTDQISYFASAQYENNNGPIHTDEMSTTSLRGNFGFRPHEQWLLQVSNAFTTTHTNNITLGGQGSGILYQSIGGDQRGLRNREALVLRNLVERPNYNDVDRNVHGFTVTFTPLENFTHRLTLGNDGSRFESTRISPFGHRAILEEYLGRDFNDEGSINVQFSKNTLRSIDYVGSLNFDALGVRNSFSFGVQGLENTEETVYANGQTFPGPGEYTVSSAATRTGFQNKLRMLTGGFFFQDLIAVADRYFLTLGLRVDGNSAFGSGFGLQPFPKASLSYVVSDEAFWPESLGSMKLRAAYGWAGRAPGAFDAVQTWLPVGFGPSLAAYQPGNQGNPDLGPEKTKELEVGFDGSFLGERLSATYTYYSRLTTDALFAVNTAPSQGDWLPQLENVGRLKNWGHELSLDLRVLNGESLGWTVGGALSTNTSTVLSLGGSPPFTASGREAGWIMEGQPVPVIRGRWVRNYWEKANPDVALDTAIGPNRPPRVISASTTINLPGGIAVSGRGEYQGTFYMLNNMERLNLARRVPMAHCYDAYRAVDPTWEVGAPGSERIIPPTPTTWPAELYAWERAKCWGSDDLLSVNPIKYFEFRDLTISLPVSNLFPVLAPWGNRADMTVSWRNIWYWKNRELAYGHPEQMERRVTGSQPFPINTGIGHALPPQSTFTVSVRATF